MKKFLVSSLVFLMSAAQLIFIAPMPVKAASASLYLTPSSGTYNIGAKFTVGVNVNTGGMSINAAEGKISYDAGVLKVVSVSKGNVFSLWTTAPTASGGSISFGGGVPHPGYKGSAGRIITITFQALKVGSGGARFVSGYVLANDGKGTNILSSMGSGNYTISPKSEAPKEAPKSKTTPSTKPAVKEIPKQEKPKEVEIYLFPEITSETHPNEDRWYNGKRVKFDWKLPSSVDGVSVSFDDKKITNPGPSADGLFSGKEYEIEKDGHQYLHLKFKDNKGRWGTIAHFRINVDTTSPKSFEVAVKHEDLSDLPVLIFETEDELSGLDRYEINIDNLQTEPIVVAADKTSFKLVDIGVGAHTAIVKAIDRAGNEIFSSVEFEIPAIDTPIILEYPKEIGLNNKFFISGTSTLDTVVSVFIKNSVGEEKVYKTESDKSGNWFLIVDDEFSKGRYLFWVESENNNGLKSEASVKNTFLVTPPIFTQIGDFVLDYFTVFVSLIFMIVLIVFLITILVFFIRKKLKKETIEIEQVLEKNINELQRIIDEDLDDTSKMSKAEIKRVFKEKVSEVNGKLLKEIKDVEKILK